MCSSDLLLQSFMQAHHHDRPEKGYEHGMVGVVDSNADVVRNRNFDTFDNVEMLFSFVGVRASD